MAIPLRGRSSEPVELRPGAGAREAALTAEIERWAWRRVRSMRLFFSHVTVFIVVNFLLFVVVAATNGSSWFYAPLIGWGMFLALHGLHAYELLPWTTHDWEQRKVRELIENRQRH